MAAAGPTGSVEIGLGSILGNIMKGLAIMTESGVLGTSPRKQGFQLNRDWILSPARRCVLYV